MRCGVGNLVLFPSRARPVSVTRADEPDPWRDATDLAWARGRARLGVAAWAGRCFFGEKEGREVVRSGQACAWPLRLRLRLRPGAADLGSDEDAGLPAVTICLARSRDSRVLFSRVF